MSRLTPKMLAAAERDHARGVSFRALGEKHGVHYSTIAKALNALRLERETGETRAARIEAAAASDAPRPSSRPHRELPVYDQRLWESVGQVRSALTQLNEGRFELASIMVDDMMADDRIQGVWSIRADGLLGLPLNMQVPEGLEQDARANEIAKAAKKAWPRIAPDHALADLLKWGRFVGLGLAQKFYPDGWEPRLKVFHPRFITWAPHTRTFNVQTEDAGILELDPTDPAVRREWIFYAPWGLERGWMSGRVRALAVPWLIRRWTWRDHARHNEVHGIPIRKVKVPSQWDPEETKKAMSEIARLASESIIRCPVDDEGNGMDVELVEAVANSYEAFMALAGRADNAIAIVLLGQNLTTEVADKGSRAAAQVHERVRHDVLRSDALTLSACAREQVMEDWAEFNHGARDLAPAPLHDTVPPRDAMQMGTALRAVVESLFELRKTQLPIDFPKVCRDYGIPLVPGVDIEEYEDPLVEVAEIKAGAQVDAAAASGSGDNGGGGGGGGGGGAAKMSARVDVPPGALHGQVYTDALKADARRRAAKALSPYLARVIAAIQGAESYDDVRARVLAAFRDEAKPEELATILENAMVLAEMNGMLSVREDETSG